MIFKTLTNPKYEFYHIKGYRQGVFGKLEISEIKGKFLSENQAKLKIETLDKSFEYFVIPEFNWVRYDQFQVGDRLYIAHPFYGINEELPISGAIEYKNWKTLWFKVGGTNLIDLNVRSCSDAGMYDHNYNDRRTFFTLREAEDYIKIVSKLPDVIKRQKDHEKACESFCSSLGY